MPEAAPPNSPFDVTAYIDAVRDVLAAAMPAAEFSEDVQPDMGALTFVHPVHDATVLLVIEPAEGQLPATLLASIVIGDWDEAKKADQGAALLAMNPRLMTCAVGLLPLNPDELAVVLCRRVPVASVAPADVQALIDDMIWEYAQAAGWVHEDVAAAPGSVAPESELKPPRPRLIGSLDEL